MNTYREVTSFEDIYTSINEEISDDNKHLNFTRYFELPTSSICMSGSSTEQQAKAWLAFKKPDDLLFNHGEFITQDGFEHIINEIKEKPGSNRALYSLLNYQKICDQGDHPIPSFLLFQVTIEDNILYATSYFRALEIAKFLKINVQEIKLNLLKIVQECNLVHISKVRITIHAFNAYKKEDQNIPKIFEIDRMTPSQLSRLLYKESEHANLIRLIMQKQGVDTYISTAWVQTIIDELTVNPDMIELSPLKNNINNLKEKFEDLLSVYLVLIGLRKRASHSQEIDQYNQRANTLIQDIVEKI
ncbi:hypothetical protein [Acinetobacter lactucae]|uniref:hypothetical protein n=1 Tax=Acinetobacter lactucae TaxID=1785128 RepID=UPI00148BDE6A|nr:hypothetical protein [Acinetobacter lactucae]